MTVEELIDKLNNLPDKNKVVLCKDVWTGTHSDIVDVIIDKDGDIIILIE